jgi:hypothetical protein
MLGRNFIPSRPIPTLLLVSFVLHLVLLRPLLAKENDISGMAQVDVWREMIKITLKVFLSSG